MSHAFFFSPSCFICVQPWYGSFRLECLVALLVLLPQRNFPYTANSAKLQCVYSFIHITCSIAWHKIYSSTAGFNFFFLFVCDLHHTRLWHKKLWEGTQLLPLILLDASWLCFMITGRWMRYRKGTHFFWCVCLLCFDGQSLTLIWCEVT